MSRSSHLADISFSDQNLLFRKCQNPEFRTQTRITTNKRPGSLRRTDPDATLESEVAEENLSSLTLSLKVSFPPLLGKPSLRGQHAGVHFQGATELPANHLTRVEREYLGSWQK